MLKALSPPVQDLDDFVSQVVPPDIRVQIPLELDSQVGCSESEIIKYLTHDLKGIHVKKNLIGQGLL